MAFFRIKVKLIPELLESIPVVGSIRAIEEANETETGVLAVILTRGVIITYKLELVVEYFKAAYL